MLRNSSLKSLVATIAIVAAPLGVAHADLKVGFVNVSQLLQEAPQVKTAQQSLQDEFAPRQRELQQLQNSLKAKADKLQKDSAVMAESERRNTEKDLRDGQRELERKQNELTEDANVRRNDEFSKIQRALLQEVESFGKAGGYDLIVGEGVLFRKDSIDVTAQVLAALQARGPLKPSATPTPKAAAPAPKP
jgi:outer membrane protein